MIYGKSLIFLLLIFTSQIGSTKYSLSPVEKKLLSENPKLVDVQKINRDIQVELKYSSKDNFLKKDLYGDLDKCFLQREVALKLDKAQKYLTKRKPNYKLKVFDGLRPRSIQWKMWNFVKGTSQQKYVANPKWGSIHNYGAAVDITIVDDNGIELNMGTPFDYFGPLAEPRFEKRFLKQGRLTGKHIKNRHLLRTVMKYGGFKNISIEWWHFNGYANHVVKRKYKIVE